MFKNISFIKELWLEEVVFKDTKFLKCTFLEVKVHFKSCSLNDCIFKDVSVSFSSCHLNNVFIKTLTYLTLKEIESLAGVKSSTLRAYILRGEVIPPNKLRKVDKLWLVEEEFVREKWIKRKEERP